MLTQAPGNDASTLALSGPEIEQIYRTFCREKKSVEAENPRHLAQILLRASGHWCTKKDSKVVALLNLILQGIRRKKIKPESTRQRNMTRYTPQ